MLAREEAREIKEYQVTCNERTPSRPIEKKDGEKHWKYEEPEKQKEGARWGRRKGENDVEEKGKHF